MLLAELSVNIPRAANAVATEHRTQWASGCHPHSVERGAGNNFTPLPASSTILESLETFPAHAAIKIFKGFGTASRIRAWLSGWQAITSNRSVHQFLPSARTSGLTLCLPSGLYSTMGCRAVFARCLSKSRTCASFLSILR